MNRRATIAAITASALILALALPATIGGTADHLDAGLEPPGGLQADINDLYVFSARNPNRTAIIVTTHPGAGAIAPLDYATNVLYKINVDRTGDAIEDVAWVFRFDAPRANGRQRYRITRYAGANARSLEQGRPAGAGWTGRRGKSVGQGQVFVGLASDPFFFDLAAFNDGLNFCSGPGGTGTDFFDALNTNAIVMELADVRLGGAIGVWASTHTPAGVQLDRIGRPAIATVFIPSGDREAFNQGHPSDDFANWSAPVIAFLEGFYPTPQATAIASILLPDVLTYDTSDPGGFLNGRRLADDVIDIELGLLTDGAITTDCVGPHDDYQARFPYVGWPH